MRAARPAGKPLVIELAGLPGAGKTSLVDTVSLAHRGRRDISVLSLPLRRETWRVLRAALRLAGSVRPLAPYNFIRAIKLTLVLRCYGELPDSLVIMDQGLVQKLWSMVIETDGFSERRLEDLVAALSPFVADHLVWLAVPHDVAARRIVRRRGGNSRFDGAELASVVARLENLESVYQKIIALFRRHGDLAVTPLEGEAPLQSNARAIESIIRSIRER
jgi:thymidylate kinase